MGSAGVRAGLCASLGGWEVGRSVCWCSEFFVRKKIPASEPRVLLSVLEPQMVAVDGPPSRALELTTIKHDCTAFVVATVCPETVVYSANPSYQSPTSVIGIQ